MCVMLAGRVVLVWGQKRQWVGVNSGVSFSEEEVSSLSESWSDVSSSG